MDDSLEEQRKEENIPLIKMSEGKTKVDYQRTISSIKDPQVRIILLTDSCLIIIIIKCIFYSPGVFISNFIGSCIDGTAEWRAGAF